MHPMKKGRAKVLQESEIDESPSSQVDSNYIAHLKSQCAIRYNALKTAETLISAYQKENDTLKNENLHLRERLQAAQDKLARVGSGEVQALEKSLLKYSQRINELLEREMEKDRRIADLEKEVRIMQERESRARQAGEDRQRRREREERRRQGEDKFNNFLKLPLPQDSFSSIASRSAFQKSSVQVLEGEVKKKDAEILALLRRLRDVQEELKSRGRKERLKTSDTLVHNSIRKNTFSSIEE